MTVIGGYKMDIRSEKRLAPVKKIPLIYPGAFSQSSIRWLIFNERHNGFAACVRRIGKKVLIDLDAFEAWIDAKGGING